MVDKRITELTELTTAPESSDIICIVDDPNGIPVTKKITVTNLLKSVSEKITAVALSQGVHLTGATSGSNGIQVANNTDINFGTGDFTLVWKGSLSDWTPDSIEHLFYFFNGSDYFQIVYGAIAGKSVSVFKSISGATLSTAAASPNNTFENNTIHTIHTVVTRETDILAGSVTFYIDRVLLYSVEIPIGTPDDWFSSSDLYISGTTATRTASTTLAAYAYNYALDADQVKDLYNNRVAFADRDGSQTALTSGTLVDDKNYVIDTFVAGDDFTNIGGVNESGAKFTTTGTTPTTWTNGSSLRRIGTTLRLEPENAQPSPGQWLDAANNHHAVIPEDGATLIRPKDDFKIISTHTWSGTSETQYLTGINQKILPDGNIRIEYITMVCTATGVNVTIGDGSDVDRFVESTALSDYLDVSSPVRRNHDGTNRKMTITPSGTFTGSITITVIGKVID